MGTGSQHQRPFSCRKLHRRTDRMVVVGSVTVSIKLVDPDAWFPQERGPPAQRVVMNGQRVLSFDVFADCRHSDESDSFEPLATIGL